MSLQEKLEALKKQWEANEISRIWFEYDCSKLLLDIPCPTYEELDALYDATAVDGRIREMWVGWLNLMCFADPEDLITIRGGCFTADYREPPPRNLNGEQKVAVIDWLAKNGLVDKSKFCKHANIRVEFDEEAAKGLDAGEVRKRWPRYHGPCPDCGTMMISYASFLHYVSGDW
jgi:hypothetical protein